MKRSPISQAPCNRVLDLFPPLAGIWRFATQTSERRKPLVSFTTPNLLGVGERVLSLYQGWVHCCPMYSLCPEPRFLRRCYHCAFHTDTLSECLCCLIFIFAEVSKSDQGICVFSVRNEWLDFCWWGCCRHHAHTRAALTMKSFDILNEEAVLV